MVDINDLYNIADAMDKQMLLLNIKEANDFRQETTITMVLPKLDMLAIDEQLYEKENGTLVGYEPGEEVNVKVLGINFKLIKEKEEEAE